jgi:hypothetical protein
MQEKHLFEYAVIRLVPRVEREEFLNVGVVLYCADQKFLQAMFALNEPRIMALSNNINVAQVEGYLSAFRQICLGDINAGPIGKLPIAERFRWLTATRSTVVQTSGVHPGLCTDAQEMLLNLYTRLVLD